MAKFVDLVIKGSEGIRELHDVKPVGNQITHELLIVAFRALSDAVDADERLRATVSGRSKLRYLTRLVAMAVGGTIDENPDLQHKVGKRLSAQVTTVSDALDRIESEGLAAISREQHRVHVAPELLPGLADRLDALMQNSETLIDTLMTEIYVGFHELRLPVRAAPEVQGAPVAALEAPLGPRAPNAEREREKALADADAAFDKEFKEEYEYYFDQGALYECMRAGTEKMALNTAMLAGDWYKLRVESCERQIASLKEELAEKVYISKCERIEELLDINDAQADRIEALKVELRVAREREAVLRDVIRENCMSSASRASNDPPAATEGHV